VKNIILSENTSLIGEIETVLNGYLKELGDE